MLTQTLLLMATSLAAVAEPSNPSSLVLALVGIVSVVGYQLVFRPGREQQDATHSSTAAEPPVKPTLVRPRRRVA